MFASRRGFLGRLGVGVLGVGGLLVPGKALARWRGCGGVVYAPPCPPPEFVCFPPPVIHGPIIMHPLSYTYGPITLDFPDTGTATIKGNGNFYVWGKIDSGNVFDPTDGLHLWSTDGSAAMGAGESQARRIASRRRRVRSTSGRSPGPSSRPRPIRSRRARFCSADTTLAITPISGPGTEPAERG